MKDVSTATVSCTGTVNIALNALDMIDKRLVGHGKRVAFIVHRMYLENGLSNRVDWNILFSLALFHDIGAYKTEEIDRMLEFETKNVDNHSLYGYLFLKEFTPFASAAEGILYHHTKAKYFDNQDVVSDYAFYSQLIHLADRVDILLSHSDSKVNVNEKVKMFSTDVFSAEAIAMFLKANADNNIAMSITDGSYETDVCNEILNMRSGAEDVMQCVEMMAYLVDFRSACTVTHTAVTAEIALELARLYNLQSNEQYEIYYAAYLHDIGKVRIPLEILESTGKL